MRPIALLLLMPIAASATPTTTGFDGRLLDAQGAPINGARIVTVTLHPDATSETILWSEDHGITASDGYFHVDLGLESPLIPVLRANDTLWVQVSVDEVALPGRTRLQAAPYALSDADSLADLQCQPGDTIRFDGNNWGCAPTLEAQTFGCAANPWSKSANTEICRITLNLEVESLVVASSSGHWSTNSTASWCIVEIVFPGETTYANRESAPSPYINGEGAHGYPGPAWESFATTRRTILPAGSHDIYLYATESSVCTVNGSSMLGWAIPVR